MKMTEAAEKNEPETDDGVDVSQMQADETDAEAGPVDQLGIPMSREPTLNDVRSQEAKHGAFAAGCTVAVVVMVAAFFLIRVLLLG